MDYKTCYYPTINSNPFERKRIDNLLERASSSARIVFVSANTGWGKTTSAVLWLRKKENPHIWISFSSEMDCYETLIEAENLLNEQSVIVLDNFQCLESSECSRLCLYILNSKNNYVIISRGKLPKALTGELGRTLLIIGSEELRLTPEELQDFLVFNGISEESRLEILKDQMAMRGWILYLQHLILIMKQTDSEYNEEVFLQAKESVYNYFDNELYSKRTRTEQDFMLAVGCFESLTLNQIEYITGRSDAAQIIDKMMSEDHFFTIISEDKYKIKDILRDYLMRTRNKQLSKNEIDRIYRRAGRIFEISKEYVLALETYLQGNNLTGIADLLEQISKKDMAKIELWKYRKYFRALSFEHISDSPALCGAISLIELISGNIEKSNYWENYLRKMLEKYSPGDNRYEDIEAQVNFLAVALPQKNQKNFLTVLKNFAKAMPKSKNNMPKASITSNRPSVLNGGRDLTQYMKYAFSLRAPLKAIAKKMYGKRSIGMVDVAIAEGLYQQNKITEALILIVGTIPFIEQQGDINILFAAMFTQMEIMFVTGQIQSGSPMLMSMEQKIRAANADYLLPNLKAICAWTAIYECKHETIKQWMENDAPDENGDFCTLDRFQYFVKLRIYLIYGKYIAMLALAERLRPIINAFGRKMELCELEMLLAVSAYNQGNKEDAFCYLEKALKLGEKYQYKRLFGDEGTKMYFLLNEYKSVKGSTAFLDEIIEISRKIGLLYPDYLKPRKDTLPPLTETELNVLRLMSSDYNNEEIGKFLFISVNTVKFHAKNIFSKLDVRTRSQAVKVAKEFRIL